MFIYRVENSEGVGPFSKAALLRVKHKIFRRSSGFPNPINDGIAFKKGLHYCGCKSEWQLRRWFDKRSREIMFKSQKGDLFFTIYEVDPAYVIHGKKQIVFEKHKAKQLVKLPLNRI